MTALPFDDPLLRAPLLRAPLLRLSSVFFGFDAGFDFALETAFFFEGKLSSDSSDDVLLRFDEDFATLDVLYDSFLALGTGFLAVTKSSSSASSAAATRLAAPAVR